MMTTQTKNKILRELEILSDILNELQIYFNLKWTQNKTQPIRNDSQLGTAFRSLDTVYHYHSRWSTVLNE